MNKKVLSAILFSALFAGTGTFTSCIDNDEPAGIEELRGAKAELLRAKVAVEQAEAAHKLALAEVEKANAAIKNAQAKQEEAKAKAEEAKAEAEAATTAEAKAEAEKLIAQYQNEMKEAALTHEAAMIDLQKSLAIAARQYELTLAQIEIAKQLFPFETYVELSKLQDDVEDAIGDVEDAEKDLADAKAEYDAAAIDYKYKGEIQKKRLENAVAKKEGLLAAAKEELAKWEGFLENDVETADWRAEVDSLDALVKSMAKEQSKLALEISRLQNSDEFKALKDSALLASVPATVDTVYGYKYFDDKYATTYYGVKATNDTTQHVSTGATEVSAEAAMLAQAEIVKNQIAVYDTDGKLTGGRLLTDKQELASFTAETKHFLDTIAAEAAGNTDLKEKADTAVALWKIALKNYNDADTTMADLYDDAVEVLADADAEYDDIAAALKAYLTVAKANGATLNQIPVQQKDSVLIKDGDVYKPQPAFALEDALTVLADTAKTHAAIETFGVNFLGVKGANEQQITYAHKGVTGKVYGTDKKLFDLKYYANVIAEAAPTLGEYTQGSENDPDETTLLGKLQAASNKAFGKAEQYLKNLSSSDLTYSHLANGYLHVMPDTADIKNLEAYTAATVESLGDFGKYVLATDPAMVTYAKTYKDRIANLEGAVAYWEAAYKKLDAIYTAWDAAKDAAADKVTAYNIENIQTITDQQTVLTERAGRINGVISALKSAIQSYLEPELKGTHDYKEGFAYASTFAERLQTLADQALEDVEEAEDNLAEAQIALEKNGTEESSYNLFEVAKANYEAAQAELDAAQAILDAALANLAKGLEILGVTAE